MKRQAKTKFKSRGFLFFFLVALAMTSVIPSAMAVQDSNVSENSSYDAFCRMQTDLVVFMETEGEYKNEGDSFKVFVKVKNIGEVNAISTKVSLQNIPDGWKVTPAAEEISFGTIKPQETVTKEFRITRDATDAEIFALASAKNSGIVSSEIIPIPISPLVLVSFAFVALALFIKRKDVL